MKRQSSGGQLSHLVTACQYVDADMQQFLQIRKQGYAVTANMHEHQQHGYTTPSFGRTAVPPMLSHQRVGRLNACSGMSASCNVLASIGAKQQLWWPSSSSWQAPCAARHSAVMWQHGDLSLALQACAPYVMQLTQQASARET